MGKPASRQRVNRLCSRVGRRMPGAFYRLPISLWSMSCMHSCKGPGAFTSPVCFVASMSWPQNLPDGSDFLRRLVISSRLRLGCVHPIRGAEILEAKSDAPELRLQVRGYVEPPDLDDPDHAQGASVELEEAIPRRIALDSISDHLFETLRGSNNLVFGGSRRTVESTADRLRRRCEKANVPNEF